MTLTGLLRDLRNHKPKEPTVSIDVTGLSTDELSRSRIPDRFLGEVLLYLTTQYGTYLLRHRNEPEIGSSILVHPIGNHNGDYRHISTVIAALAEGRHIPTGIIRVNKLVQQEVAHRAYVYSAALGVNGSNPFALVTYRNVPESIAENSGLPKEKLRIF
ncbi:hypothetical protein HY637_00060 [Candidatus Woesearchaeota archaeon]|nr:hypothetical protein [Candidatus Woesearchaeota archaeon]